jgi:hypothetical protein
MSMSSFFVAVAGTATLALCAGCAQQPVKEAPTQQSVSTPATPLSQQQLLSMARDAGYQPVTRDGKTIYCHKEIPTGSMLPVVRCINAESLRFAMLQARRERELMNQNPNFQSANGN